MNLDQLFEGIAKLQKAEHGMGMTSYQNDDILLAGGTRSGNSDSEHTRLKYIVYDIKGLSKDEFRDNQQEQERGYIEVFVKYSNGEIDGLVNIVLKPKYRKGGYGKMIIKSLMKTVKGGLKVFDIKPSALTFWKKMGVTEWYSTSTFDKKMDDPSAVKIKLAAKRHSLYGLILK